MCQPRRTLGQAPLQRIGHVCYIISVPRKTKQEKIIAGLRRKLETTSVHPEGVPSATFQVNRTPPLTTRPITQNPSSSLSVVSTTFIKKDLTKTLFLSLLAISF